MPARARNTSLQGQQLTVDDPRRSELVDQHAESFHPKGRLHGHSHFSTGGEPIKDPLRFGNRLVVEGDGYTMNARIGNMSRRPVARAYSLVRTVHPQCQAPVGHIRFLARVFGIAHEKNFVFVDVQQQLSSNSRPLGRSGPRRLDCDVSRASLRCLPLVREAMVCSRCLRFAAY